MNKTLALILIIIIFILGALLYIYNPEPTDYSNGENVVCTMEAKQCPDGSYVGRSGPKCEFAACPGPQMEDGTLQATSSISVPLPL